MIQIREFPIKKSIYYEITTVLMAIYGGFHTFSADHKSLEREKGGCRGVHLDFTQLWRVDFGIVVNSCYILIK